MNKIILVIVAIAFGVVGYYATLNQIPKSIYNKAKKKLTLGDNTPAYPPLPNENVRSVVMPNGDFLYVSAFYNLNDGPVRVTGQMPGSSYWSISFYQPNTVNYYIKNDLAFNDPEVDLILTHKSEQELMSKGVSTKEIITTPTAKGFMLFRILVKDHSPENLEKFKAYQQSVKMTPV